MGDNVITGWEPPHVLFAALAKQMTESVDRIRAEELTVAHRGVTVVIGLTGFLTEVSIEPRLRGRCPAPELAALVLAVISRAERVARERRADIAEDVLESGG